MSEKIDEWPWSEIAGLRQEVLALRKMIGACDHTIKQQQEKISRLTALLDAQLGTPCEQIRHSEEIERLRASNAELKAALEEIVSDPTGVSIVQAEIAKQALARAKGEQK